ncbi:MAG: peptidoglycan-binding protein [Bryobacterales bacterium]|nr:peptidoglycan-binding protein [Bryobacterales bacterium]
MKPIAVVLIVLLATWTLFSAPTGAKKKSAPKAAVKSSAKNTSGKKTAARKTAGKTSYRKAPSTKSSRYARGRYKAPAQPRGQSEPTPDRYREIQQALAAKGYLGGEPTGKWDAGSMDALKRFQQDQNLNASGKLDSLSLIALGLGPQRTQNSAQARPQ